MYMKSGSFDIFEFKKKQTILLHNYDFFIQNFLVQAVEINEQEDYKGFWISIKVRFTLFLYFVFFLFSL